MLSFKRRFGSDPGHFNIGIHSRGVMVERVIPFCGLVFGVDECARVISVRTQIDRHGKSPTGQDERDFDSHPSEYF